MWHNAQGQRYLAVDEAHRRLGPIVRISSNHLSFSTPSVFKEIYNYRSQIIKDDFYETIADGNPSMAQTADKQAHGAKRRNLAHVFSAQQITAMEPRVVRTVETLCQKLALKGGGQQVGPSDMFPSVEDGAFDLRPWMNMTSFDVITSIFWSNPYGFLDKGNDICPTELSSGSVVAVRAMDSYHSAVHFNAWLAHFSRGWYKLARKVLKYTHGQQAGDKFSGMARWLVRQRLHSEPEEKDLFSSLPIHSSSSSKRPPMTFDEIHAECTTMLDAGNDTTQTSLSNCMYQLARHPDKQARLRAALQASLPNPCTIPTYSDQLQHIPYLRACLDESFRLRTPLGFGLPRKIVDANVMLDGHHILPGTTVSAPLYTLHLNEQLFHDARSFIPERWLPADDANALPFTNIDEKEKQRQNLKTYVLPFSLGSRACIGRNLAYMELSIVIAALVLRFEWELARPEEEMRVVERFNSNPAELFVRARRIG